MTNKRVWPACWLDEILEQAEAEVKAWPEWMQESAMRYPANRHVIPTERDTNGEDMVEKMKLINLEHLEQRILGMIDSLKPYQETVTDEVIKRDIKCYITAYETCLIIVKQLAGSSLAERISMASTMTDDEIEKTFEEEQRWLEQRKGNGI